MEKFVRDEGSVSNTFFKNRTGDRRHRRCTNDIQLYLSHLKLVNSNISEISSKSTLFPHRNRAKT